jgi:hypothetical protein
VHAGSRRKPAFYSHVQYAVKQGAWDTLYTSASGKAKVKLKQSQDRTRSKAFRTRSKKAAVEADLDPQLCYVMSRLKLVWPGLSQSKKDRTVDQWRNEGREGKAKCGRRWVHKASTVFARRLVARAGTKFLHWVDENVSAMPTGADTYRKDVAVKLGHWGLQEGVMRACAADGLGVMNMRDADLTFSVDEMAIDQSITYVNIAAAGGAPVYRLDGFANCCASVKYGAAQVVTVERLRDFNGAIDMPHANQVSHPTPCSHPELSGVAKACLSAQRKTVAFLLLAWYVCSTYTAVFYRITDPSAALAATVLP